MLLRMDVLDQAAIEILRTELEANGTGKDEVQLTLRTGGDVEPCMTLGCGFALDGELAERLASVPGLAKVQLDKRRGGSHLRLVA